MTQQVARNTAFLTTASVGQKLIAFAYFLFVARVMQPLATGEYFLAVSITVIFTVMADMGVTPVVIREVAQDTSHTARLLSRALAIKLPLVVLSIVAAVWTARLLGYGIPLQFLVALATVVLALDALHLLFYGVLRGYQRLRYEAVGVFAGQLCTGVLGGLSLWLHPTLPMLVLALIAGSLVNLTVSASRVIHLVGWRALVPVWERADIGTLLHTAFPFALASIFVKVYSYVDSILISKLIDTTAVGIYSVAYRFTYSFQFLPLAFVAALYPGMSAVVGKDPQALERIFLRGMWYMALLSTPLVLGINAVSREAVLLAGEGYAPAAPILAVLVFVLIPIFLDFPIGSLLNASHRQSTKTAIMGVTMVINIVLNLLLIPRLGILGAAYAALACFSFMFLAGLWFVPRVLPLFSLAKLLRTLLPIWLSGAAMYVITIVGKPYVGWLAIIPIAAAVYVAMLAVTGTVRAADLCALRQAVANRL